MVEIRGPTNKLALIPISTGHDKSCPYSIKRNLGHVFRGPEISALCVRACLCVLFARAGRNLLRLADSTQIS
jgi:hypothetical protein